MNADSEKPILQTPEFWLGQIAGIARLEREGRLTRTEAMKEVQTTLKEMQETQPTKEP